MTRMLLLLLPERDRETVAGDLLEERQARIQKDGFFRAQLWYAVQVLSFVPAAAVSTLSQHRTLTLFCFFTGLSGTWLGAMDLRLRHPGYLSREGIALTIVLQSALTLCTLVLRMPALRVVTMTGTIGILWLAWRAFYGLVHGAHFEGYILLIALALAIQSALTWFAFLRRGRGIRTAWNGS